MAKTHEQKKKARKPAVGSDAWVVEQQKNPEYARGVMKDLAASIAQGSKWAVESLEKWIAKFPHVARSLSQLGDLCAAAEAEWVKAMAGDNPIEQMGVKDEIARMKAELLGEKPSILEQMLVSSIVTAHLAHQRAVIWAARPAEQLAVTAFREKRVESTARRLLMAVKTLSVVRQQQARGLAPRTKLKVFEASA